MGSEVGGTRVVVTTQTQADGVCWHLRQRSGGGERGLAVCDEKHRDEPFVPQVQPWEESG